MSPRGYAGCACDSRFPRVSGDEPFEKALENPVTLFSPRERG